MRVVVIGATGNVGTSVLHALSGDPQIDDVVAVARRRPNLSFPRTTFVTADIVTSDLTDLVRGADAVISLAWLIQPGRDESVTRQVNVEGNERVFRAVVRAGVPTLLYASSVGAYSPGPKDRFVDESWPTEGIPSSFYSRTRRSSSACSTGWSAKSPACGSCACARSDLQASSRHRDPATVRRRVQSRVRSAARRPRAGPRLPRSVGHAPGRSRARTELGWRPRHSALDAVSELLAGMRDGADLDTPPLSRATGGTARLRELLTEVGRQA
jgi:nucleoside-diphosphate-sugar epimerase